MDCSSFRAAQQFNKVFLKEGLIHSFEIYLTTYPKLRNCGDEEWSWMKSMQRESVPCNIFVSASIEVANFHEEPLVLVKMF